MRTDDVLNQISATLDDYSVSLDAMRCAPADDTAEPMPHPAVPLVPIAVPVADPGRFFARLLLTQRLVDRHDLHPEDARLAVLATEAGQTTAHTDLVTAEARNLMQEAAQRAGHALTEFVRALQPLAQTMAETLKRAAEAFSTLGCDDCGTPARRRPGLEAQRSPYGPQRKGRR